MWASILVQLSCMLTNYAGQHPWCDCPQSQICTAPHCHHWTIILIFSWTLCMTRVPHTEMQGISMQDQSSQCWWTHCIHMAGLPLYGLNTFHPAWGMLNELKALLVNDVIWKVFSATFPPHILKTVMQKVLKLDCIKIQLMSNHPNTMYTTHKVQGSIEDPRNYKCFPQHPFNFDTQPHVLIFFDDKVVMKKVTEHLDDKLPHEHCGWGVVQHYHSGMSEK